MHSIQDGALLIAADQGLLGYHVFQLDCISSRYSKNLQCYVDYKIQRRRKGRYVSMDDERNLVI